MRQDARTDAPPDSGAAHVAPPAETLAAARALAAGGQRAQAISMLSEAGCGEHDAEVAFTLGCWLLADDRSDDALRHFRTAAHLAPQVAAVHINLATAALRNGKDEDALAAAREACRLAPDDPQALTVLGNALSASGDLQSAQALYETALRNDACPPGVFVNLGHCLLDQRKPAEAQAAFKEAVDRSSSLPAASNGLGLAFQMLGEHSRAIQHFEKITRARPDDATAWGNLAVSLQCSGDHAGALEVSRRAIELSPHSADAALNHAHILQSLGRHLEAIQFYEKTLELKPDIGGVHAYLLHSRRHECLWDGEAELIEAIKGEIARGFVVPPFALAGTEIGPEARLQAAKRSAGTHAHHTLYRPRPAATRKLKIGFVSPDFRTHSLAMSFSGLVNAPRRHEWVGYSTSPRSNDGTASTMADAFDAFVDIRSCSVEKAAEKIRADGVDVLVDLAGHTRNNALDLFAREPAPVQAHYLGYGATVGADFIPWLITDRIHTPRELEPHCHEALAILPQSFMGASYAPPQSPPARSAADVPETGIVFACFNASYKIEPAAFASWLRILGAVPDSVLWLRGANERVAARLRDLATNADVAADRLVFSDRLPRDAHLSRHQLADIALDTFNHAGGVTTIDALIAGTPVVTLAGENQTARTGASILASAGLSDLIAASLEEYEQLAITLANDSAALATIKQTVRQTVPTTPLFDPEALTAHLETALQTMHRMAAEGRPPATFSVDG